MRELIIDSFAGGGGASEGIRMALGRDPDIAINHDPLALAMHRINHPGTRHMVQDVATVDAVGMCGGAPIGMLWMSPDCTDHSKAKGAAPRRDGDRTTRGIGWAIVGWVKALPVGQRPRVVFLENVEEYVDWGPLLPDGKRCPARKGETFKAFVAAWRALGYGAIEWRLRRAWWSGSGTIRRRLYMILRRDGAPIVWPEREFGNPGDPADAVRIAAGALKPWVTIAQCLDFGLPCPSIFATAGEIRAKHGLRAKRPLVPKTLARVAKGVRRYVLDAAAPFLVKVDHTARAEARDRGLGRPLGALTGKRDDALVAPFVTKFRAGSTGHAATEPLATVTAHSSETHGGGAAPLGLVAPVLAYAQQGGGVRPVQAPAHTFTASRKDQNGLLVPYLVPRYGERAGQAPRSRTVDAPGPTPVPSGNEGGLVAAVLAQHNGGPRPGSPAHSVGEPVSTISTRGAQQQLVAAHLLTLGGSDRRDAPAEEPARTVSAGGAHHALVSLPLLHVYYGSEMDGAGVDAPGRTETTRDRFGLVEALAALPPFGPEHEARARAVAAFLRAHGCWDGGEFVTIDVEGVTLVLVDIGMRMLTPRERFTANGFPADYMIDHGIDERGRRVDFTLEQQGHMCGNAVCPTEARALVAANYRERAVRTKRAAAGAPLFAEAAE